MISLYKLTGPENETIFEKYPQLNGIWEIPTMQKMASESYTTWNLKDNTGEIFLIKKLDYPVGITGWWLDDEVLEDTLRLRWYGIVPEQRGHGYGETAISQLLERLSTEAAEKYKFLSESVSLGRPDVEKIIRHFEKMGFEKFDDPKYEQNGHGKTQSLRIRLPNR